MTEQAKTGRPSIFTDELADEICQRIAEGESLRSICRDERFPAQSTVFRWLTANKDFQEQYAHAREAQADFWADEIIEISDDGRNDTYETENGERTNQDVIARSRLRVDTRKWLMARMAPKKYGDKVTQEIDHKSSDGSMTPPTVIEIVALKPNDSPRSD